MKKIAVIFLMLLQNELHAQNFFAERINPDSTATIQNQKNKRVKWVLAGNIIAYGGTMIALYDTWYKNYPQSNFHFFNDNKEWLQVDKVGHAWSAYSEAKGSTALWLWAGLPRKKAIWIGGLSGLAYQSIIEVLDGFSAEWGFSWGDYVGNVVGSSMFVSQQLAWNEQRIQFKFSSHRKDYGTPELNARADELYGTDLPQRTLKDYNAQAYWLSANLKSFFKESRLPKWLNVAVGYGAEGMFGAVTNKWTDKNGIVHDRTDIKRYRQWYLSPDVDLTKIKTKSKFLRTSFFLLNSLKFPAPALEFSNSSFKWRWFYF